MFISGKLGSFFSSVGFQTAKPWCLNESGGRPERLAWEEAASEATLLQLLALSPPSAPHNLWIHFSPWWPQPEWAFQNPGTGSRRPSTSTDHWLFPAISNHEATLEGQIANLRSWISTVSSWGWGLLLHHCLLMSTQSPTSFERSSSFVSPNCCLSSRD